MKPVIIAVAVGLLTVSPMSAISVTATDLQEKQDVRHVVRGVVKDSETGRGIPGVAVSDGYVVTLTDAEGVYSLPVNGKRQIVSCTIPSAYEIPLNPATGLPAHYGFPKGSEGPDFILKAAEPGPFEIIAIGDPQARSDRQVSRYQTETLKDVQTTAGPGTLAFALGDNVSDSDPTWEPMFKAVNNLKAADGSPLAYFAVMGNHDTDRYDDPVDSSVVRFENYYGPRNFSLDRDGVHIVVMDDIFRTEPKTNKSINGRTWKYTGGFSEEQYRWLLDDFSKVENKESKTLVFICHIPFHEKAISEKRNEFLKAFTGFGQAHILCGHNHRTINYEYKDFVCAGGTPVYCHVHVAAGGDVWFSTIAKDNTPNGYGVYSFSDGNLRNWHFKATDRDASEQFDVYNGNDSYALADGSSLSWDDAQKGAFIVDLWNGDENNWKVELFSGKKKMGDFKRIEGGCCNPVKYRTVAPVLAKQKWANPNSWKKGTHHHLWMFVPKSGDPSKVKNWEVRATQTIPGSKTVNVYTKKEFVR